MEKEKEEKGKGISRRAFVKKIAYVAPVVTTLIIPKYTSAKPPCPHRCSAVCLNQCPLECPPRCPNRDNQSVSSDLRKSSAPRCLLQ
jgi:hypothetical protein